MELLHLEEKLDMLKNYLYVLKTYPYVSISDLDRKILKSNTKFEIESTKRLIFQFKMNSLILFEIKASKKAIIKEVKKKKIKKCKNVVIYTRKMKFTNLK